MTLRDISTLIIKIAGMIIIVISISDIANQIISYAQYQNNGVGVFLYAVILPSALPILLGIMLFLIPNKITNRIVKIDNSEDEAGEDLTLLHLEQIALTTMGSFLLFKAGSDIAYHIINFAQAMTSFPFDMEKPNKSFIFTPEFLATIVEFIFATWLIFSTKGIAQFMKRLRSEE